MNGWPTHLVGVVAQQALAPELNSEMRPRWSMPISAVVLEARSRWSISPAAVRSAVTSMPVITTYAACPSSSKTMLLFHTTRSSPPSARSDVGLAGRRDAAPSGEEKISFTSGTRSRRDDRLPDRAAEDLVLAEAGEANVVAALTRTTRARPCRRP